MLVHIICRSAKYKYEPSNQFKFRSCANDICTLLAAFWIFLLTLCNCYKHLNTFVKSTSSSQHTCQHKHNIFGKDWLQNGTMTCTPVQCADEIQSCKKGFYWKFNLVEGMIQCMCALNYTLLKWKANQGVRWNHGTNRTTLDLNESSQLYLTLCPHHHHSLIKNLWDRFTFPFLSLPCWRN